MVQLLETELKTYERRRDHLLGPAEGKFVLIRNDQVIGIYDSKMDAVSKGYRQFGNVPGKTGREGRSAAEHDLKSPT
jgi:hypothetical protein